MVSWAMTVGSCESYSAGRRPVILLPRVASLRCPRLCGCLTSIPASTEHHDELAGWLANWACRRRRQTPWGAPLRRAREMTVGVGYLQLGTWRPILHFRRCTTFISSVRWAVGPLAARAGTRDGCGDEGLGAAAPGRRRAWSGTTVGSATAAGTAPHARPHRALVLPAAPICLRRPARRPSSGARPSFSFFFFCLRTARRTSPCFASRSPARPPRRSFPVAPSPAACAYCAATREERKPQARRHHAPTRR